MARKNTNASAAAAQAAIDAAKAAKETPAAVIETAGEKGQIVLVRGPEDGRRRGGLTFGPVDVEVDLGEISKADFLAIMSDPYLRVRPKAAEETDEAE